MRIDLKTKPDVVSAIRAVVTEQTRIDTSGDDIEVYGVVDENAVLVEVKKLYPNAVKK